MKRHLGNSGFSILEIVVASIILAILVGSSMTFMSNTETKDAFRGKVQKQNACLADASRILGTIKEKGQDRFRAHYPMSRIQSGNMSYTMSTDTDEFGRRVDEFGTYFANLWPEPIYEGTGDNVVIRPHHLIMGYMKTLAAEYNRRPTDYCNANGNLGLPTSANSNLIPAPALDLSDISSVPAESYMRIQVFNTLNGQIGGTGATPCWGAVNIRPAGQNEALINTHRRQPIMSDESLLSHPNTANQEIFDPDPTAVTNLGFLVTATVRYQDRKGEWRSCSVQEKFVYGTQPANTLTYEFEDLDGNDSNRPDGINSTIVTSTNVANPPAYSATGTPTYAGVTTPIYKGCGDANNDRNIQFRMTRTRPGSIHMCRNLSTRRAATPASAVAWADNTPNATGYDYTTSSAHLGTYSTSGFAVRFGMGLRTTFDSAELLGHDYWKGKEQDAPGNLFAAGLYYPAGTYYCLGIAGCGGGTGATPTEELINRALPRIPRGSYNPGGTLNTHYVDPAGGAGAYRYYIPSDHSAGTAVTPDWIPCEAMTAASYRVCEDGVVSEARMVRGNSTETNLDAFQMRITGLTGGCEVHIQIAEVDAGYNIKTAEFKDYIQEKVPGNKLCRNQQINNGRFNRFDAFTAGTWFFACTNSGDPTFISEVNSAPNCGSGVTGDCCADFPFYPEYRAYVDRP